MSLPDLLASAKPVLAPGLALAVLASVQLAKRGAIWGRLPTKHRAYLVASLGVVGGVLAAQAGLPLDEAGYVAGSGVVAMGLRSFVKALTEEPQP